MCLDDDSFFYPEPADFGGPVPIPQYDITPTDESEYYERFFVDPEPELDDNDDDLP